MLSPNSQQTYSPVIPYKPNLLLAQLQTAQYKIYKDFPQNTHKKILTLSLPYLVLCSPTSATCLFTRCVADSQSSVTLRTHLSIYQSAVWSQLERYPR